jgi:hypothetical protein
MLHNTKIKLKHLIMSPDSMRKENRNKRKEEKKETKERGADWKKEEKMPWVGGTGGRPWVETP